jgi:hypothetical protein
VEIEPTIGRLYFSVLSRVSLLESYIVVVEAQQMEVTEDVIG